MSDEEQPLLRKNNQIENSTNSDNSSESLSIKLSSFRIPVYGSQSGSLGRIVPLEERATYAWNRLDVFTNAENNTERYFCNCFSANKSKSVERKHILKNVSGIAYSGQLLGILGSSGAGKTTLLNALTFRPPKNITVTGERLVNGVPVTSKSLTSKSAYVQQDDLFIGVLTVKEHLIFQALVRMDRHLTYEQRMERVEEVIAELSLNKCENSQIGIPGRTQGISGGEQKRLAFASEVLTNPSLMFCDEPTSGLDSYMALNVIQVLKNMAHTGKTVVCTIHQPSSELYALFDKVLLMAEGRISFLGTPEEAEIFFRELDAPCPRNYNPADYFIQLLAIVPGREESCKQAVNMICDRFEVSDIGINIAVESASKDLTRGFGGMTDAKIWISGDGHSSLYKASWCCQFRAVLWRSWISISKEPLIAKVRVLQTIMVSLLLGAIYYGQEVNQDGVMNINGVIYIFITNMTFQNIFAVINVFCSELPIFLREHRNGMYRTDIYFLSKTLAETPIFVFLPIIYTTGCYFLIGLNPEVRIFFKACGIIVLVANASTSFGYLISCASSTTSTALSIGPPLIMPLLLFGGFFLNIGSIPFYFEWISYLSWFRFGNEALLINQWENIMQIDCIPGNSTCPKNGHIVLEIFSFKEENFLTDIVALCSLILVFRLTAYGALLWRTYKCDK